MTLCVDSTDPFSRNVNSDEPPARARRRPAICTCRDSHHLSYLCGHVVPLQLELQRTPHQ